MVNLVGERMSKGTRLLFCIEDIVRQYDPEVVCPCLLSTHYRCPIDFSHERLAEAGEASSACTPPPQPHEGVGAAGDRDTARPGVRRGRARRGVG
jgi:hypothetical protein